MQTCPNCDGNGLVGQGPSPWLRQGHITTCPVCTGTGILNEDGTAHLNEEVAPAPAVEPVDEEPTTTTVGGILKKMFG